MATTETADDWVPAACTLPTVERPLRVAEFDLLFGSWVSRSIRTNGTTLELMIVPEGEPLARDLAEREARCCSFFRFDFDDPGGGGGVVMRIGVPTEHVDVLDVLEARLSDVADAGQ